jgi:hypothetical protein
MRVTGRFACRALFEVPARHPEDGFHVELAFVEPELAEVDVLRVAQEPRRFVVPGPDAVVQGRHPEDYLEAEALRTQLAAGGRGRVGRARHESQDRSMDRRLASD